jgi:hypothetical protein
LQDTRGDWILSHEDGVVPDSLLRRLTELASVRPLILLIIGYSERDAEVVKRLIHRLVSRWRLLGVSLSATGEGAELAHQLAPERVVPGWSGSDCLDRAIEVFAAFT